MIYNFYSTSLIFIAGFCLFSAFYHFNSEQPRQQRRAQLLFGGITLSMVLSTLTMVISSNTSTAADHITWVRVNLVFNIVTYALLPWFFALYSGVRPIPVLAGSTVLCILLFFINLTQPNTMLYSEIQGIERLLLPWGESVFLPKATPSIWGVIIFAYLIFVPGFAFYTLVRRFRRDRRRSILIMMFAVVLLVVSLTQAGLTRVLGIHNLLPLGMFGLLSVVIIMGMTLTSELKEDRRRVNEALRQSEVRLNSILTSMKDIVFEIDINGCFEGYFSPVQKNLYRQPDLFIGEKISKVLPEDVCVLLQHAIDSINAGNPYQQFEYHLTIDNTIQWEQAVVTPRYNTSHEIIGITAVCRDISEHKKVEDALFRSEAKYRDIVENAPMGIFRRELGGKFHYVNPCMIQQLECKTEKELLDNYGLISQRWVSPERSDEFNALLLQNRKVYGYEIETRLVNNTIKWFSLYSFLDDSDQFINGFSMDITERKKNEAFLIKLYTAINNSQASIVITDVDGNIEFANPYFTQLTGYSEDEYLGKSPRVLKSGNHNDEFYKVIWDTIKSGNTWNGEFCNRKKNGELYWENSIITPIKNEREEIISFVAVKTDITERKLMEEQLLLAKKTAEAANIAKSQFLANMSHEIRTPMNGVMGMLQLLQQTDLTSEQIEYVTLSRSASDALLVVVNDILDYSKIEAGKMELEKITFDFRTVINDVMSLFKIATLNKDLIVEVSVASSIPNNLIGDSFRLRQIIINIIGNAIKFTQKGRIDFSVRQINELNTRQIKLEFVVKDTGIGIPTDKVDVLFKSFSQADNSHTRRYGGAGLGLSICKSLIEKMDGEIWVESVESEGSTFYFTCVLEQEIVT